MRCSQAIAAIGAALVLSGGCYSVSEGQLQDNRYSVRYQESFGYFAVGVVPYSSFFGKIEGVDPGMGVTVYVPPLAPVQTVAFAAALVTPVVAIGAVLEGDVNTAGELVEGMYDLFEFATTETRSGAGNVFRDATRDVISDFSFDLGFAYSLHQDSLHGGQLDYYGVILGVRLAGPRERSPRLYGCGGLGWYWFQYDNRPNAFVPGPYAGIGMEFIGPGDSEALGLEVRSNFYFGDDDAGEPVDGGAIQLIVQLATYW